MPDPAAQSQPRPIPIPGAGTSRRAGTATGLKIAPPLPPSVNTLRTRYLALDTFSPVNQNGSFESDRIIKSGQVFKRTRKTKQWKPIFLVLRPGQLSLYRDQDESKLRHKLTLSELTAVARQKDPKRKDKHVFALFSPSRNFHLEAKTAQEAQEWVELISREARIDEEADDILLASPGGAKSAYHGFERGTDANISNSLDERGGYSSSDIEAFTNPAPPTSRARDSTNVSTAGYAGRRPSVTHTVEYSGAEGAGSYSDFSDSALSAAARVSALSLSYNDGRPSTSSIRQQAVPPQTHSVYLPQTPATAPMRPSIGARNPSQLSNLGLNSPGDAAGAARPHHDDSDRVVYHGWIQLLKSARGVRQWKRVWMVLRPRALALYKNEEEYSALMVLPFEKIIEAVEINAISKSKQQCMQIISEERNYRFCALDEESLMWWLGAFKSLLSKRKAAAAAKEGAAPGGP